MEERKQRFTKKTDNKKLTASNERSDVSSAIDGIKRYANLSPSIEKNWENFVNKGVVKVSH